MLNVRSATRRRRLPLEGDCATCLVNTGCWREPPREARIVRTQREALLAAGSMLAAEPTREVLWLVRSGALKVVRLQHDGTETVVDFRLPGELVAATPAPSRESAAHITALTETTVCRLVPPDTASAAALAEYWRLVATSMQQQWERALEPWPSLPAFERVARFLADLSKRLPHEQRDGTFELPMTRAELGSRLGLTEETVCRALRKLQTTKRIHVAGRHVRLLPEAT